jgi:hypothetical protein
MKCILVLIYNIYSELFENLANVTILTVFSTQINFLKAIENDSTAGLLLNIILSLKLYNIKFY